ncbi:MAG TPA: insulinase family protein [Bacteroidetes bacterium]|nr:insulinase family protein [Bacteroidota bacterium]
MRPKLTLATWWFVTLMLLPVFSTDYAQQTESGQKYKLDLQEIIPIDARITTGRLDNGLQYFIRENKKPENRAELRLIVNVGSILENDDQQGLAHFTEHMCFNGTKHFAKNKLVNYLESIGMKFGPDVNANTGFDETKYLLQVPTDSVEILEKAFLILEDWAHNVSFADDEIDKERGVIIEEWRLGRGANARMFDKQLPVLFKGSRYAERLPIGKKDILESFQHDTIRRFYRDWYRPDLMAVIAVGDFDKNKIENMIKQHFAKISLKKNRRERKLYPVPDHKKTLFAIATDPEAVSNVISVYYLTDIEPEKTVADYRNSILEGLYSMMLNQRLSELTKKENPPFIYAFSGKTPLVRTKDAYTLAAVVKENGIGKGLEAVLVEDTRVRKFGFTQTELERAKKLFLRNMERTFNERNKTQSSSFAAEYSRHFLTGEPIPGIEYENAIYQKYIPKISLAEINSLNDKWIKENNRVILVNAPKKKGVKVPTESELLAVFQEASKMDIKPYEDKVSNKPLIAVLPTPGRILFEKKNEKLGTTEWKLSNGVRVVLKPTDFKNDEIRFDSFSPGGHSLVPDKDYLPGITASIVISGGGLGNIDEIELGKMLTGKIVSVSPYIAALYEGVSGMASPKDMETMFQLIYLTFTAPREDSTAFIAYQKRTMAILENKEANPASAFGDTIKVTMAQHHYRERPLTEELLKEMNLEKSFKIYKDRFADAGDFTFFFVGNIDLKKFKKYVKTYLASLPAIKRKETWKDVGIRPPKGVIKKIVKKGIEPKSRVTLIFTGPYKYSRMNNYLMDSMANILRIRLREVLREDLGGTYGVGVRSTTTRYPDEEYRISISFGCAPDRVDELTKTVLAELDSLKKYPPKEIYIKKVKETQLRSYETKLKENTYWLNAIYSAYMYHLDPNAILSYPDRVAGLTAKKAQETAQKYLNLKNYATFELFPETGRK